MTPPEAVPVFAAHFRIPEQIAARDVRDTMEVWNSGLLAVRQPRTQPPEPHCIDPAELHGDFKVLDCLVNGRHFRVRLEAGHVHEEIAPRLAPVLSSEPSSPQPSSQMEATPLHTYTVFSTAVRVLVLCDDVVIGDEENSAAARAILLQSMAHPFEPAAILHAGGCGGVLIAGQSHSGKTTLCAALMARGLPYHCDDSAVLLARESTADYRVVPMPFSIMLRQGSWPILEPLIPALRSIPTCERWGDSVRFLSPSGPSGPTDVRALVFVHYNPDSPFQTSQLSVFESLLGLQASGFWVEHSRSSIHRFLNWLDSIPRYRLDYSGLPDALSFVDHLTCAYPLICPWPKGSP